MSNFDDESDGLSQAILRESSWHWPLPTQNFRKPKMMSHGSDELDHEGHGKAHWCKGGFCFLVKLPWPGEHNPQEADLAWAPGRLLGTEFWGIPGPCTVSTFSV